MMSRLSTPLLLAAASTLAAACKAPVSVESYLAVVHLSPSNGSANVDVDAEAMATFSEPLVDDSVSSQNIYLADQDGETVDASLIYNDEFWTVFVAPDEALLSGERYDFVLGTGLEGTDSGALVTQIKIEFTTAGSNQASNTPPVADSGDDQAVDVGDEVQLDGSGSYDPDDDELTWFWELIDLPEDSEAALDDPNIESPSFTADVEGIFVAQLTVSDGMSDSTPDYVQVEAVSD